MGSSPSEDPSGSAAARPASAAPSTSIAPDCTHYRGDRPCIHNRLCSGCTHYAPYAQRICIIKFGALGDVIRTLCILPELRKRYPGAHVTWVSAAGGVKMIEHHPLIDRTLRFDPITAMVLAQERFDVVINLDKDPEPCALAMSLSTRKRLGLGLSPYGTPVPIDHHAEYYMHLGLSDALKFHRNNKSYPQLIHEALGWAYDGQRYTLPVIAEAVRHVRQRLEACHWDASRPTLGINTGAGDRFANKMWPAERIAALIVAMHGQRPDAQVLLLGGAQERKIVAQVFTALRPSGLTGSVLDAGTDHDEQHFLALIDVCDVIFSGDTMALHTAVARSKPVVGFFGPTCAAEIDLFGKGCKLVADVACAPCYKHHCDQGDVCIAAVSVQAAAAAIGRVLDEVRPSAESETRPRRAG